MRAGLRPFLAGLLLENGQSDIDIAAVAAQSRRVCRVCRVCAVHAPAFSDRARTPVVIRVAAP